MSDIIMHAIVSGGNANIPFLFINVSEIVDNAVSV